MNKKIIVSLLAMIIAAPLSAADFKLGVVDFQKSLNGVEEGKAAKERLKKEFEQKQKDLDGRKGKLDKLQTEITDLQKQLQSGVLKPEAREKGVKLETEFRKQLEEYTQLVQQHQRDISEKEAKATQEIIGKLKNLVVEIGRADGYNMVMEANESGLVYASQYTDLTEKLIQRYNSQYKPKK